MATSLRTKRRLFDLNRISMLNKASHFDHKYDISFSHIQSCNFQLAKKQSLPNPSSARCWDWMVGSLSSARYRWHGNRPARTFASTAHCRAERMRTNRNRAAPVSCSSLCTAALLGRDADMHPAPAGHHEGQPPICTMKKHITEIIIFVIIVN